MKALLQALDACGIRLPQAPQPVGNYRAISQTGNLLFVAGQLPIKNGKLIYQGKIGTTLTIEQGQAAAELCALNILSQLTTIPYPFRYRRIVKLEGFIHCPEGFTEHARVLDGASNLFARLDKDMTGHVRSVLGCNSLPLDAALEIAAIIAIDP